MFYLIVRLVSANHKLRRYFILIIESVRQVNHKVWRSPSNSVAVAIQQYGSRHPTIWQSPHNNVSVGAKEA